MPLIGFLDKERVSAAMENKNIMKAIRKGILNTDDIEAYFL